MPISEREVEEIAARAVVRAFREMGIHGEPADMQRDMAYLRDSRKRHDGWVNRVFNWLIGAFILGGVAAAWKEALANIFKSTGAQ